MDLSDEYLWLVIVFSFIIYAFSFYGACTKRLLCLLDVIIIVLSKTVNTHI